MIENFLFKFDLFRLLQVDVVDTAERLWGTARQAYSQTGSAINSFMIDCINNQLFNYGQSFADDFVRMACYLGAIFAICVAAAQAYKVMARGEEFNVLSVMRPLIFAFVLTIWIPVCNTLLMPGATVERIMRTEYAKFATVLHDKREYRHELALKVNELVNQKAGAAEKTKEETDSNWFSEMWGKMTDAFNEGLYIVANWWRLLQIWAMYLLERVLTGLGEIVWSVGVYIVFLTKVLYLTVLMMFGPVFMVCSILDVWKDQWATWVGRMIHVSFYGAMAYLVMIFSCHMITYAMDLDIQKLNVIIQDPSQGLSQYLQAGFGTTIMTLVGYVTGAIAMGVVHELASLTFPGSPLMGASSVVGGMAGKAMKYTGTRKFLGS